MKKYTLAFLLCGVFSHALADEIASNETTDYSLIEYTPIIGVFAVVLLLIVRRVRKRRQM